MACNSLLMKRLLQIWGETRAFIGGSVYSCIHVLVGFMYSSLGLVSKEIRQEEHEYMNIHSPFNPGCIPCIQYPVVAPVVARKAQLVHAALHLLSK